MVAAPEPGGAVRGPEQRFDLCEVQVGDLVALVALGGDRHHPGDRCGVLGVLQRGVSVEAVDRGQAVVARAGAVVAVVFEVGEERADQRRVEIIEVELVGLFAGVVLGEGEQQTEGVAVGRDRVGAGVALGDQSLGEERLEGRGEQCHDSPSGSRWSRRELTWAISSGTDCRYQ